MPTTSSTVLIISNINNTNDSNVQENDDLVSNIFTTVSTSRHGRRVKPSSKLFESLEESGTSINQSTKKGFLVFNNKYFWFFLESYSSSKNFMDQFTNDEREIILEAEKAGACEEKNNNCFDEFQIKTSKKKIDFSSELIESNVYLKINNIK